MTKAVVVFATITGNNEDVADLITDALENLGVDVDEKEITMADVADFEDADICVVCGGIAFCVYFLLFCKEEDKA